jgi:hypothetical protein
VVAFALQSLVWRLARFVHAQSESVPHKLRLAIDVVTDRSLTTQGDTANPTGRIYPRRIIPWDAFATEQEKV